MDAPGRYARLLNRACEAVETEVREHGLQPLVGDRTFSRVVGDSEVRAILNDAAGRSGYGDVGFDSGRETFATMLAAKVCASGPLGKLPSLRRHAAAFAKKRRG